MAGCSSDTVDGGKILDISERQQLNITQNEDSDRARPQSEEISQKEAVSRAVGSVEQSSVKSVSHLMKDDITPCRDPSTTRSSLKDGVTSAQSLSVTSESQDKTDSEIIDSQSCAPGQSEATPTSPMGSLESEEANGMTPDAPLISTESVQGVGFQSSPDKVPCQGDEGATAGASRAPEPAMPAYYFVKWITWKEKKTAIITQSENGPCPLIAIMNILLMRWKMKLPPQTEVVTTEELMAHLGECVLSIKPREEVEGMELNFQQNMSDAMAVLPKLSTGLDVNVRFTGVCDFEYTPECIVFDLLDIPLYHGWLVDPQSPEMASAVGKLSYNQLVEKIIEFKHSTDSSRVSEGLIAEQFLESTATQLSYHGLCELNTTAKEEELCVFFRNNHFSTMIKHKGHLYLLVTDQGFLQEENVVWESLHNVEGDGNFCDSDFRLCHVSQKAAAAVSQPTPKTQQQMQIQQDYLVAMSLQQEQGEADEPLSDLELAQQLQQEEYQQPQTQHQPVAGQARGQAAAQHGGQRHKEKKDSSDCCIL